MAFGGNIYVLANEWVRCSGKNASYITIDGVPRCLRNNTHKGNKSTSSSFSRLQNTLYSQQTEIPSSVWFSIQNEEERMFTTNKKWCFRQKNNNGIQQLYLNSQHDTSHTTRMRKNNRGQLIQFLCWYRKRLLSSYRLFAVGINIETSICMLKIIRRDKIDITRKPLTLISHF